MAFAVYGLSILGALVAVAGFYGVVSVAFAESTKRGLVCLFVPGAFLLFALTRWPLAWRGFSLWAAGTSAIVLSSFIELPVEESPAAAAAAKMFDAGAPRCARGQPPGRGFARFCCGKRGWEVQSQSGCRTLYAPSEPCTTEKLGTTQLEGCGTTGRPAR